MSYKNIIEGRRKAGLLKYSYTFKPNIGLHRVSINKIRVSRILTSKLFKSGARFIADFSNFAITDNGVKFSSIYNVTSSEHLFNEFKANGYYDPISGNRKMSVVLDFSPSGLLDLFSVSSLNDQINSIKKELSSKYGLALSSDEAKLRSAEISAQFILKEPLSAYSRAFHIIKSANINDTKMDVIRPEDGYNQWESCIFKKPSYEMYIYDKSKELYDKHKIILSENIIKVELRLPKSYLYQSSLKGDLNDLTDEKIKKCYRNCLDRTILTPYRNWHKQYISSLDNIVYCYRESYSHWMTELYKYCIEQEEFFNPVLIDWQDIMECPYIKSLDTRTKTRINKSLEQQFKDSSFNRKTSQKLAELLNAIESCFNGSSINEIRSNKPLSS